MQNFCLLPSFKSYSKRFCVLVKGQLATKEWKTIVSQIILDNIQVKECNTSDFKTPALHFCRGSGQTWDRRTPSFIFDLGRPILTSTVHSSKYMCVQRQSQSCRLRRFCFDTSVTWLWTWRTPWNKKWSNEVDIRSASVIKQNCEHSAGKLVTGLLTIKADWTISQYKLEHCQSSNSSL